MASFSYGSDDHRLDSIHGASFLAGHSNMVVGSIGKVGSSFSAKLTSRAAQGDAEHLLVVNIRVVMTAVLWLLAFLGGMRQLFKGYHDESACYLL